MSVTRDILRSWRAPRQVVGALLQAGRREDRALVYLILGCLVTFVAQWPRLMRVAQTDPEADFTRLVGYEFFGWLIVWPLLFYGLAALVHLVARGLGGRGPAHATRLALFWAVLAAVPAVLLAGLTAGLVGPGPAQLLTGVIWVGGFLWIAAGGLRAAHAEGAA